MDQLEGYVPDWNAERSSQLIGHLQTFSNDFFAKIESLQTKTQETRFLAKDYHLKVKKDFHAVLAIADKQFMEHVPAKPEESGEETEKPEEVAVTAEEQTQKVKDKLKLAGEISISGCTRFIEQEGKVLAERGDRTARNSSMTSSSIFSSFRSDIKFPPIIDSKPYGANKYLGLCTRGPAFQAAGTQSTLASDSSSTQSQASIPADQPLFESSVLSSIQVPTPSPSTPAQPPPRTGAVPPPPPGFIPPPPPIALLGKIAEQRKKELGANPGTPAMPPVAQESEEEFSHLTTKQKLELMLNRGQQPPSGAPGGMRQPAPEDSPLNQSISQDSRKKSLLQASLFDGKKPTAGGFFDDEEDDGETLLKRPGPGPSKPPAGAEPAQPPASSLTGSRQQSNPYALPPEESGSMLDSILKKKTAPTFIDEANPFSRQPTKPKPSLFDKEDEEDEPVARPKKDKFKSLMNDESDEEEKRKKLIQKYAGADSTAPADPRKKKNKLLEEDEPTEPVPPKKEKGPVAKAKKLGFEDSEDDLPPRPPKAAAPAKPAKQNRLLDDEEVPLPKPPARKNKLQDEEESQPAKQPSKKTRPLEDPEDAPPQAKPKTPRPAAAKTPAEEEAPPRRAEAAEASDEEQGQAAVEARASVKNVDFMSRLSAQLGKGPKPGFGSVVQSDNDYLDPDIHGIARRDQEADEAPSLLKSQYRSQRASIDQISAIKPVADRYFEQNDLGEEAKPAKKSKKNSVIIQDAVAPVDAPVASLKKPVDRDEEGKASLRKSKKPEPSNGSDDELPKPPQKPAQAPKREDPEEPPMLRGRKKKDPFANSSDDEPKKPAAPQKPEPQTAPKPAEEEPVMLRGKKKKDPFANSSDDEPKKPAAPQKAPPGPAPAPKPAEEGPVMLRGKKKKDPFDASSGEEMPQPPKQPAAPKQQAAPEPAADPRSSEGKRKNRLLGERQEEPAPAPAKKPEAPKPAGKKKLLAESSEEEPPQRRQPQDKKKKLLADSEEDEPQPAKPAPRQPAAKGKKKLFEDSD